MSGVGCLSYTRVSDMRGALDAERRGGRYIAGGTTLIDLMSETVERPGRNRAHPAVRSSHHVKEYDAVFPHAKLLRAGGASRNACRFSWPCSWWWSRRLPPPRPSVIRAIPSRSPAQVSPSRPPARRPHQPALPHPGRRTNVSRPFGFRQHDCRRRHPETFHAQVIRTGFAEPVARSRRFKHRRTAGRTTARPGMGAARTATCGPRAGQHTGRPPDAAVPRPTLSETARSCDAEKAHGRR